MLSEEVEDEILALESIYDSLFTRTEDDQIRAVITPTEEHDVESSGGCCTRQSCKETIST